MGCVFAQVLAGDPNKANWRSLTNRQKLPPLQFVSQLGDQIESFQAIQLIFPGAGTAKQAADLVVALCADPAWTCYEMPWKDGEKGNSIPVGLRWQSPKGFTSWILGIAPFEPMPFTRKFVGAPFLALVYRPSPPADRLHATDSASGLRASHLAHVDDLLGSDEVKRKKLWDFTGKKKRALLGPDFLSTARAQVTFALPLWCRDKIAPVLKALPEPAAHPVADADVM
jgi:hypothetical protein